jgi:Condensation domain
MTLEPGSATTSLPRHVDGEGPSNVAPAAAQPVPVVRDGDAQAFAMSPMQKRIWLAQRLAAGSGHCIVQRVLRLRGPLDVARLARSLNALVRRHESLRTAFPAHGETQVVQRTAVLELPTTDLAGLDPDEHDAAVRRLALAEARRPFDLARAPLLRTRLLRLGDDEHALLFAVHNIVCDGWSLGILFRELAAAYGTRSGDAIPGPAPPIQYADYTEWRRRRRDDDATARSIAYWRTRLAGVPRPRRPGGFSPATDLDGARRIDYPDDSLADAVAGVSRRAYVTPFAVFLAAYLVLLRQWSGTQDPVVGIPVAGRRHLETRSVVGLFVDMVVIRGDLAGRPTFVELVRRMHATVTEAIDHQDVPFARLVEELDPGNGPHDLPFFDIVINYTGDRQRIPARWGDLAVGTIDVDAGTSTYALTLFVRDEGRLKLELVHRTAALTTQAAAAFLDESPHVPRTSCADPQRSIDDLAPRTREPGDAPRGPAA